MNPFTRLILRGLPGVRNQPPPPRPEATLDNVIVNGVESGPLRLFEPVEAGLWLLDFLQGRADGDVGCFVNSLPGHYLQGWCDSDPNTFDNRARLVHNYRS
jgi:hypothetical protein